ncbi:fructose-6-phosphate aldolase [Candidatus Marinamargulisbacteria bacterium SCGC AG-414-C22]|nr:fructose-6-phosphate aldolase [Candidatus Marinamargulisbacteria bacterium SCGC AG-414-C22]
MEFFIDTADIDAIKKANDMGLVDGVTTNPTLIKKAGRDHEETIREISSIIDGPISVETLSSDANGMLAEAEEYMTWGSNIVIKVVMTPEGMKVVKALSEKNIKTNVTVTFSPLQALIAAKAGATYISPFVGRLDDIGHVGMDLIEQIRTIYDNYGFSTKILVASVRSLSHILESSLIGADVVTVPPDVLLKCFNHPLTDKGVAQFVEDAKAWKQSVNC